MNASTKFRNKSISKKANVGISNIEHSVSVSVALLYVLQFFTGSVSMDAF